MEELPSRRQFQTGQNTEQNTTRRIITVAVILTLFMLLMFGGLTLWQRNYAQPPVRYIEGALDCVSVEGRPGATPVVTLTKPLSLASSKNEVVVEGSGREILADSPVLLGIYAYSAQDGSSLTDTAAPRLIAGSAGETDLGEELAELVIGKNEGSRIVAVRPTAGGETEIDVVDILPIVADGVPVDPGPGPLVVDMTEGGPQITHTGSPPSGTTIQTLLQGDGPQIRSGDTVVAQYFVQKWTDSSVLASTWGDGQPKIVRMDQAMTGLQNTLIDQRVGSRLALTIPPEAGTGEDTLVVVVDILGVGAAT